MSFKFFIFLIGILSLVSLGYSQNFDAKSNATWFYQQYENQFKNPSSLQQNFINPLLGGGTLSTLDKTKNFNATISCPSSSKFLEIIMQPQRTGDINFYVHVDTNLDGKLDRSFVFAGVSGLCVNGFIRCDPGTWNNCVYYTIELNGASLIERRVSLADLNSCFCVNNFCGSNLSWRNKEYVLKTFGGVIVSAYQKANPGFAVSNANVQDVVINYYGQSTKDCQVSQDKSNTGSQVSELVMFYDVPSMLKTRGEEVFRGSSYRSLMVGHLNQTVERRCTFRRVITEKRWDFTQVIVSSEAQNCPGISYVSACGENCLSWTMPIYISAGGTYSSSLSIDVNPEFKSKISSGRMRWCTQTRGPYPCTDDDGWYVFQLNGQTFARGSYKNREKCGNAPAGGCWNGVNVPVSSMVSGINTISVTIGGAGGPKGVLTGCRVIWGEFLFNAPLTGCYIEQNYIEDNCISLRNDPKCVLKDRVQNGVITVKNRMKTGLTPLTQCIQICEDVFCFNDWTIEETYECDINFSLPEMTRAQEILKTIAYDGSVLRFDDIRKEGENYVRYPSQSINIKLDMGEACPEVCRVRIKEREPEVGNAGPISVRNLSIQDGMWREEYRECKQGRCPIKEGEEVIANCACLTAFNEAIAILQSLRLMGEDIICSSGVSKPLPGY
ncbi:MAG: hypothetical protein QXX12_06955 [Nanopusillaceae archaeon]